MRERVRARLRREGRPRRAGQAEDQGAAVAHWIWVRSRSEINAGQSGIRDARARCGEGVLQVGSRRSEGPRRGGAWRGRRALRGERSRVPRRGEEERKGGMGALTCGARWQAGESGPVRDVARGLGCA